MHKNSEAAFFPGVSLKFSRRIFFFRLDFAVFYSVIYNWIWLMQLSCSSFMSANTHQKKKKIAIHSVDFSTAACIFVFHLLFLYFRKDVITPCVVIVKCRFIFVFFSKRLIRWALESTFIFLDERWIIMFRWNNQIACKRFK